MQRSKWEKQAARVAARPVTRAPRAWLRRLLRCCSRLVIPTTNTPGLRRPHDLSSLRRASGQLPPPPHDTRVMHSKCVTRAANANPPPSVAAAGCFSPQAKASRAQGAARRPTRLERRPLRAASITRAPHRAACAGLRTRPGARAWRAPPHSAAAPHAHTAPPHAADRAASLPRARLQPDEKGPAAALSQQSAPCSRRMFLGFEWKKRGRGRRREQERETEREREAQSGRECGATLLRGPYLGRRA